MEIENRKPKFTRRSEICENIIHESYIKHIGIMKSHLVCVKKNHYFITKSPRKSIAHEKLKLYIRKNITSIPAKCYTVKSTIFSPTKA